MKDKQKYVNKMKGEDDFILCGDFNATESDVEIDLLFELTGIKTRLLLLEVMAMGPTRGSLFLAFADETSAKETYGAGRYIDIKKIPGASSMVLDFNNAYNPYCAYTDGYSCPFPPGKNILKVAIKAGEKSYH